MSEHKPIDLGEQGVDVPYERLDPETLRNVIEEFVTRDGSDWGEAGGTLEEKISQVMQQLRSRKIKIVFELNSESTNIVVNR